jgi:S-DNA-T family DNA segregation ATPase FtsK/SpoIIIE
VNENLDLRVSRTLQLLRDLKQTVGGFAKREDSLSRSLLMRTQSANKTHREALAKADSSGKSQLNDTEELYGKEKARIRGIFENRRNRVKLFESESFRKLPRQAHEAREAWLGDLQMRRYHNQSKLQNNLTATKSSYDAFSSRVDRQGKVLTELQRQAHRALRGYWLLGRTLDRASHPGPSDEENAHEKQIDELDQHLQEGEKQVAVLRSCSLARIFSYVPFSLLVVVLLAAAAILIWHFRASQVLSSVTFGAAMALIVIAWCFHHLGLRQCLVPASAVAETLGKARETLSACRALLPVLAGKMEEEKKSAEDAYAEAMDDIQQHWSEADDVERRFLRRKKEKVELQVPRIIEKIDRVMASKIQRLDVEQGSRNDSVTAESARLMKEAQRIHEADSVSLVAEETAQWEAIEADWKAQIIPLYDALDALNGAATALAPGWEIWAKQWTPPTAFVSAVKFGRLDLDLAKQPALMPKSPRLALPGPAKVSAPLILSFPTEGSLLIETRDSGNAVVIETLNTIILRLLATTPPGKIDLTIIDPVGLGQSFAGLMYLSDYQESLINRHIWTQQDQIDQRLGELNEQIEKIIQMYLRNEYANITEYNEKAGSVAEKYHFLVVADFPAAFSEVAAKRLHSIATSGARCGIFTLIHSDQRQTPPEGLVMDDVRKSSVCIQKVGNEFVLEKDQMDLGANLGFDSGPVPDLAIDLIHKIGKSNIDSNRVEVPFEQVTPEPGKFWTVETTNELRIAIGRTGATKLQYLALGKGTRQHALFAGKTGSGKSTLFHVIITNLALTCSPDQVEFYLIDFKKGVEFKCYATKHLPHARVVAIESDREFALSVLQRVDGELRRRGDLFRKCGAQDLPAYKRSGATEPMPRTLLIIDEFQEFFVEDDSVAQTASLLLDRIVRQGRAFGIHVLLGSQTLGGAYSLARATLGQMSIRVALQCNEADAYLIMDESNAAPRLLSRPGEGIYNDSAGAVEGNSPFQVVWLPDEERDLWLDKVRELATVEGEGRYSEPIVFEGNAPADIGENRLIESALNGSRPVEGMETPRCWLGAPNSIKGPTEVVFERQSGSNLLIVGQHPDTQVVMLGLAILALAAQHPPGMVKIVFLASITPNSVEAAFIDSIWRAVSHEKLMVHAAGASSTIHNLALELDERLSQEPGVEAPAVFLCIHELQRFKALRREDDFSFSSKGDESSTSGGADFERIINEGASCGIHVIATVDTVNNINHIMSRKTLSEFSKRVVFQMSANDSSSLIDSAQASNLGLYRAAFYNEQDGALETFRPYASPDSQWLSYVTEKLTSRSGALSPP